MYLYNKYLNFSQRDLTYESRTLTQEINQANSILNRILFSISILFLFVIISGLNHFGLLENFSYVSPNLLLATTILITIFTSLVIYFCVKKSSFEQNMNALKHVSNLIKPYTFH